MGRRVGEMVPRALNYSSPWEGEGRVGGWARWCPAG